MKKTDNILKSAFTNAKKRNENEFIQQRYEKPF